MVTNVAVRLCFCNEVLGPLQYNAPLSRIRPRRHAVAYWLYKRTVEDIMDQLQAVQARVLAVAEAGDTAEVNLRLEALEHSIDILRICVSALRDGVSRHLPRQVTARKKF